MSRMDRLKELSNPLHGPQGAGRDQKNLDYWADCATANSKLAPRASNGPMDLPSTTNRQMGLRGTKSAPRSSAEIDARMRGKDDLNNVGDSRYLRGVRRQA
jgi:hypothetical protein